MVSEIEKRSNLRFENITALKMIKFYLTYSDSYADKAMIVFEDRLNPFVS
jgi:hypothetical protein